jgi:tripartite-type tricarboxylate transporter receptor subunit TctC
MRQGLKDHQVGLQARGLYRRQLLLSILALGPSPALSQEVWPGRPIRIIVPFAPGASSDTLARLIAAKAAPFLGSTPVIENRAGAGGLLAAQHVARSAPDGTTLLWGGGTAITHAVMHSNPGFDVLRDFTPIITLAEHPAVLGVRTAAPWQNIAGLLRAATTTSGGLRYGSGGIGTPAHMAAAAMLRIIGAEGTHVPYRGANQATLAVEQGEVDFAFAISNIAYPRHQQGAVRILCTAGSRRMTALPEVPTLAEAVPGGPVITSGSSLVGPAGIPAAIVARLHESFATAMRDAELRASIIREGGEVTVSPSPSDYAAAWEGELHRLQELVRVSGAQTQ